MNVSGLDLAIIKTITSDKNHGMRFAHDYNHELFEDESQSFAFMAIDYMRSYRDIPSRRTLAECNPRSADYINLFFDEIDSFEYNEHDFSFDLERLKCRYTEISLSKVADISTSASTEEHKVREIASILKNISLIKDGRTAIQKTVKEHFGDFKSRYKALQDNPSASKTFKTGFSAIDWATGGGLSFGELFIIGGETNAGKSIFLNTLARNLWLQDNQIGYDIVGHGANVLYFSLEMSYDECFSRWLASVASVPDRSVSKASLTVEDMGRVKLAEEFIMDYPYEFEIVDVPRNVTVDEIELRFNDSLLKYTPDIVVVDYMGIMAGESAESDWLKLGNIAADLHGFARAYNVVLPTAVQLTDMKRATKGEGGKTEEQRVGVHRVGRSSQVMHHANVAAQIDSRPSERNFVDLKYNLVKNRKGPLARGTVKKNFEQGCLIDIPYTPNKEVTSGGTDLSDVLNKLSGDND